MAKYIHKQTAIQALVNEANIHKNPIKRAYTRSAAIIEQITAEDVQPVIYAAWIVETYKNHLEWYKCSNCKYTDTQQFNYCPKCGAKMLNE